MLQTNSDHLESDASFKAALADNENVMVCCGRMGPMCIPVYHAMQELKDTYDTVAFFDIDFDTPTAMNIKMLPECRGFMGLPFTVYFKKGAVVSATTSIQTKNEITAILNEQFK